MHLFLTCCVLFLGTVSAYTQGANIPNGDFERWTTFPGSGTYKDYEEPSEGWASGNGVIHVAAGADPVLEKTTDAQTGAYAAKLVTRKIFGQIASGSLYTGKFQLNLSDPGSSAKRGIPFTDKPTHFFGLYKYLPQGSDSATIFAILSRWDGTKRVAIAEARLFVFQAKPEWTTYFLKFAYVSNETPDTISVVFASSAGAAFFKGDEGSTLYIDNTGLQYDPVSVSESHTPQCSSVTVEVYSLEGSLLVSRQQTGTEVDTSELPNGCYLMVVTDLLHRVIKPIVVTR